MTAGPRMMQGFWLITESAVMGPGITLQSTLWKRYMACWRKNIKTRLQWKLNYHTNSNLSISILDWDAVRVPFNGVSKYGNAEYITNRYIWLNVYCVCDLLLGLHLHALNTQCSHHNNIVQRQQIIINRSANAKFGLPVVVWNDEIFYKCVDIIFVLYAVTPNSSKTYVILFIYPGHGRIV